MEEKGEGLKTKASGVIPSVRNMRSAEVATEGQHRLSCSGGLETGSHIARLALNS